MSAIDEIEQRLKALAYLKDQVAKGKVYPEEVVQREIKRLQGELLQGALDILKRVNDILEELQDKHEDAMAEKFGDILE